MRHGAVRKAKPCRSNDLLTDMFPPLSPIFNPFEKVHGAQPLIGHPMDKRISLAICKASGSPASREDCGTGSGRAGYLPQIAESLNVGSQPKLDNCKGAA